MSDHFPDEGTQLDRIEAMLERILQGARWMLDPVPVEDDGKEGYPVLPRKNVAEKQPVDKDHMATVRPRAYIRGQEAQKAGLPRAANPYVDNRGGWRLVWDFAHEDSEKGLDRLSGMTA